MTSKFHLEKATPTQRRKRFDFAKHVVCTYQIQVTISRDEDMNIDVINTMVTIYNAGVTDEEKNVATKASGTRDVLDSCDEVRDSKS